MLDAIVQLSVKSRQITSPPGSASPGERWIVAAGATGAWSGKSGQVAVYMDGGWVFYTPRTGWTCYVEGEGLFAFAGASWQAVAQGGQPPGSVGVVSASGASIVVKVIEQEVTLAGASVDTAIAIPNRAIVLAVSVRTMAAITGATSYNCGVAGEANKFGGMLSVIAGSTNTGVVGPTAYYASTPIRLSAVGGNFSGGKVRVAIQFLSFSAPAV